MANHLQNACDTIFKSLDSDVDEIGIVFIENDAGKVILEGTKLGIPHKLILSLREYLHNLSDINQRSFISVICSGDNYTAWARRKELVEKGEISLAYELRVVDLVLSKQPKSGGAWEHRRFLASCAIKSCKTAEGKKAFLFNEIKVCESVCKRHPRTYFAWAYRSWLSGWMSASELAEDITRTKDWIALNLSDGSAFNHLNLCISKLLERKASLALNLGAKVKLIMNELVWCASFGRNYPKHEAIWMYRRSVCSLLLDCTLELNQLGDSGIRVALRSVDVDFNLTEEQRFKSYEWWMHYCDTGLPNLDSPLQVLFDEVFCTLKLALGDTSDNRYSVVKKSAEAIDRKFAIAYCGWLSDRIMKTIFASSRTFSEGPKTISPGFLEGVSIDDLIHAFPTTDIGEDDFVFCFSKLTKDYSEEDLLKLFHALDVDGNGSLNREEFLAGAVVLCGGRDSSRMKINRSFELLDSNGNGYLERAELKLYCLLVFRIVELSRPEIVRTVSLDQLSEATVDAAFELSKNGKYLTCEEFISWLRQSTSDAQSARPSSVLRTVELAQVVARFLD